MSHRLCETHHHAHLRVFMCTSTWLHTIGALLPVPITHPICFHMINPAAFKNFFMIGTLRKYIHRP